MSSIPPATSPPPSSAAPFTIFIDGQCPLCRREARFLRRLDRGRGRLLLLDISAPDFNPSRFNTSLDVLLGSIHGLTPDGTRIRGLAVFRLAYAAVGYAWLCNWTAWPLIRPLADAAYRWFARNRMRLTFRAHACTDPTRCRVDPPCA